MLPAAWLGVLLLAAPTGGPPRAGLWAWNVAAKAPRLLGPFGQPSVDAEGRLLYATNAAGQVVRLKLDEPGAAFELWLKPTGREPAMSWPLAAPKGGRVAIFRAFPLDGAGRRLTVEVYDRDGAKLCGPLPLIRQDGAFNGSHLADWHPDGELLAFPVTEGRARRGLYVFHPVTHNWVLAEPLPDGFAGPWPQPRFQPNGRSLSHVTGDTLILRAGGDWGSYQRIPVRGRLQTWLSDDLVGVLEPGLGLGVYDIGGAGQPAVPGFVAGDPQAGTLPSVSRFGRASVWPRQGEPATLELRLRLGQQPDVAVWSFAAGRQPYGLVAPAPAWHPDGREVYLVVP